MDRTRKRDLGYRVARNLRSLMASEGLTYEMFGDEIGVKKSTVSMWVTNKRLPSLTMMTIIAEKYHTTVESLIR